MYSIILAAGSGTRMAPLSHYIPKLLLPVKGKPVLSYLLENLAGLPIDTHYIVASKQINTMETYLEKTGTKNVKVVQALGWETGGDLAIAMEEINRDEDVVVMNGDLITDFSVNELWKFHKEKGADATISLFNVENEADAKRLGSAELDKDGRVLRFIEKPKEIKSLPSLAAVGIYILDKRFMERRREYLTPRKFKLELELWPRLAEEGKLYGHLGSFSYYWDVGTIESYLHAENFLAGKRSVISPQ
ncbi:MAG: nucleotidyltransferase family protein [Candidatus Micrarchaeaceae archaeon]|jgi:mannose-1-phosphate guanylyltransferase